MNQNFQGMSNMIINLLDDAKDFDSKAVAGLLRGAPDLEPLLKHIKSMYTSKSGRHSSRGPWYGGTS